MIFASQPPEKRSLGWGMVHEVFRLDGKGGALSIATFESMLDAEQLVETLDWEWPGEYVICHFVATQADDAIVERFFPE